MSKLPNYCKYLFLFSGRLRRRRGGLRLTTWLIHYKKPDSHPAVLLNSFKFCPPVVFIWFWLFISCLRERSVECVWVGGLRLRYYNFFPIIAFHFFSTIKLIYTLVYQPWNSYFLSVFWDMNLSQTVSNHIIGIWVILGKFIHACENFTFHLQTEKRCKICEWDGVFTQCINSLKIAIIIYRCIINSTSMMLTNEIEHNMQQWNY